jgi:hypothetical protein
MTRYFLLLQWLCEWYDYNMETAVLAKTGMNCQPAFSLCKNYVDVAEMESSS